MLFSELAANIPDYFDMLVKKKIRESVLFFKNAGYNDIDEKLTGLLISLQFDSYRRIVSECPDRQFAEKYMQSLMTYHLGGWEKLFDMTKN